MKLSKQQKVLCGVLSVGLVGITIDRLTAGGESESASAAIDPSSYAVPQAPAAAGHPFVNRTSAPVRPQSPSLAARLQELGTTRGIDAANPPDAFAPRGGLLGVTASNGAAPPTPFQAAHRLSAAVMSPDGRGHAMVNGKLVRLGQTLDGYRLVAIGFRKATFERQGTRFDLVMAEAP